MAHLGVPRGTARQRRSVALLATGVLTIPALAGCSSDGGGRVPVAMGQDIAPAARDRLADGSTLTWAIDAVPATLNAFQADADGATTRITGALLPTLFPLDERGEPRLDPDYLESAKVIEREPKQVVLYKLNQRAVWSDGREIGAPDFVAQWRALSGKDSAFWTARNAGYERIEKIERGKDDLQVRVTFSKPYADWRGLFSPLYPKEVTGAAGTFNDGARTTLKNTAGPFRLGSVDKDKGTVTLVRDPRWWGDRPKLESLVFRAVKPEDRADALTEGSVDVADVDPAAAHSVAQAARYRTGNGQPAHGPGADITPAAALRSWAVAHGSDEKAAEAAQKARAENREAVAAYAAEQKTLSRFAVRKSLEPAYTQLALNGESGPLSDERVRRAVARALDRQELADAVLKPLGLAAKPPGSHLALAGQPVYKDASGALGDQDAKEARALLADAGWTTGGAVQKPGDTKAGSEADKTADEKTDGDAEDAGKKPADEATGEAADQDKDEAADKAGKDTGATADKAADKDARAADKDEKDDKASRDEGLYIVGDEKPGDRDPAPRALATAPAAAAQSAAVLRQVAAVTGEGATRVGTQDKQPGGAPGAYAPQGTAAPAPAPASNRLGKDGKPLTLRFVLPSGPGSQSLRGVGEKIVAMLDAVGIGAQITKVSDESYFKDHIASGDYDMALYSWPATAYPATDGRPVFAKPEAATDGSLLVEQNYTRIGSDHIDQLFDRAVSELDAKTSGDLLKQADARIWAAAGSIPLYQRPQLVAVDKKLRNVGAFGFASPRYQDIGFLGGQAAGSTASPAKGTK
ncbi:MULTISPECIES: ABC transporter family substrate-binding protein [unclassified Streptomyces]|uniref:ABC transporter family substrate-binding protein n=1 Tax=unclassified Streptomyces TaxID=2593676 RepID=UPI000804CDBF|nr:MULTISPECIES: ABC transporter family substrate-binding protein [unclassified Streptomyces]MYR74939.1 ABC transporter family substrate-binding protein [Streptomyces sp. SID4925]SBU90685.1 peptide/nickel transport system substrate-binding protein [Streptomyces sp. OspMP-M45]